MYELTCQYLGALSQILIPCVFLRMVFDAIRNYIFKN